MRVALLVGAFLGGKGGAEKVAATVANLIVSWGWQASVICSPGTGTPGYPVDERVEIIPIRMLSPASNERLRGLAGRFDIAVGFGLSGFYTRIPNVAKMLDVPFAIQECTNPRRMVQSLYIEDQPGCETIEGALAAREAVFHRAAAIRFTVPEYTNSVPRDIRHKVHAFYNALAHIAENPAPAERRVIAVGAMKGHNKNGMTAVRAFADARLDGWEMHLFGKNSYAHETKDLAGVIDRGIVHNADDIYGGAGFLAIPSFDEGLPNVVVEAFSYGVPCIGFSDCPGVNHLIKDGVTGFLVDRSDAQGLAGAMRRLADPTIREPMARSALEFARANFRRDDFEKNWRDLMQKVYRARKRPTVAMAG